MSHVLLVAPDMLLLMPHALLLAPGMLLLVSHALLAPGMLSSNNTLLLTARTSSTEISNLPISLCLDLQIT